MSQTIYLASGNAHKLHELQTALDSAGLTVQVLGPDKIGGMPDVEETGSTFEANSLLKAHGLQEVGPADAWYLADDSGIEIDALDGRPGVISARYAGEPCDDERNNDKVLAEMQDVPDGQRCLPFSLCARPGRAGDRRNLFREPAKAPFYTREEGMAALDTTPCFYPMKVPIPLPRSGWMKKQKSATVRGHLPN